MSYKCLKSSGLSFQGYCVFVHPSLALIGYSKSVTLCGIMGAFDTLENFGKARWEVEFNLFFPSIQKVLPGFSVESFKSSGLNSWYMCFEGSLLFSTFIAADRHSLYCFRKVRLSSWGAACISSFPLAPAFALSPFPIGKNILEPAVCCTVFSQTNIFHEMVATAIIEKFIVILFLLKIWSGWSPLQEHCLQSCASWICGFVPEKEMLGPLALASQFPLVACALQELFYWPNGKRVRPFCPHRGWGL